MNSSRTKILLFLAFFLSGASGLAYQTVWVRMLTRYLGATTHATATVLGVFLGGLALGSFLAGRRADRIRRLLTAYALLEVAIAVVGLLASFVIVRHLGDVYVQSYRLFDENQSWVLLCQVVFSAACLLVPTTLMGATLPLLVTFVTRLGRDFQSGLGRLYSINTYGAVAGVFATGFVILGALGETGTLLVAAMLNLLAAGFALAVPLFAKEDVCVADEIEAQPLANPAVEPYPPFLRRLALFGIFLSGVTALAYELLWTRMLVLMLHTSIYSFSAMLGIFLIGVAWGSWDSTRATSAKTRPLANFALLEILIGCWAVAGMLLFPYFDVGQVSYEATVSQPTAIATALRGLCPFVMILPIAFLFGRQFPIAVRCCVEDPKTPGRATGRAYSANTLGTILGSIATGFFLVPLLGTAGAMLLFSGLNVAFGCLLLRVAPRQERAGLGFLSGSLVAGFALLFVFAGDPYHRVMTQRVRTNFGPQAETYYYREGISGTTVAAGDPADPRARMLYVNGMGMTMLVSESKLMTHLPYLLAKDPKRLLVICFGMGTTFRSASRYADLHIDAVDIMPEVFDCFGSFHRDADDILKQPNVQLHSQDGRNYLLVNSSTYDVITIDPAPPIESAGTVNLYTREFFTLCRDRLTQGGVCCMWLPPAPEGELLMIMKTFSEVFADSTLWGAFEFPGLYMIGGNHPIDTSPQRIEAIADQLSRIEDLGEWGPLYRNRDTLRQLFLMDSEGIRRMTASSCEVTDDRPYTEFPLWRNVLTPSAQREFTANVIRNRSQVTLVRRVAP